jgi:hypothetical protein
MSISYVLICVVSLSLQSPILLNIHNQCKDIDLISSVYFMRGGRWHVVPDHKIDVNTVMQNCIGFDFGQDALEGALAYRLQRKHVEFSQDESKRIWLLVAWEGEYTKGLHVCALVIEHDKKLDGNKLKKLYQKHWPLLKTLPNATGGNWTLNDTTKLTTAIRVTNRGCRCDVFISKE